MTTALGRLKNEKQGKDSLRTQMIMILIAFVGMDA
jgi:hypothetical protein